MPDTTYKDASTGLHNIVPPYSTQNVLKRTFLLSRFERAKEYVEGGNRVQWNAIVTAWPSAQVQVLGQDGNMTIGRADTRQLAVQDWVRIVANFRIDNIEDAINRGPLVAVPYISDKIKELGDNLRDKVAADVAQTAASSFEALQLAVDSTGTYAGLNRATYANWAAVEVAVSGPISFQNCFDDQNTVVENVGEPGDIQVSTHALYGKMWGRSQAHDRVSVNLATARGAFGPKAVEGIMIGSVPLVPETKIASGERYTLNLSTWKLRILRGFEFKMFGPIVNANNPFQQTYAVAFVACLSCERPYANAKSTGLT